MAKIVWDKPEEREYSTGLDRGVLYPFASNEYEGGVPWNGLTSCNEAPSGAEATPLYADNIKYANLRSAEEYKVTIGAYMYPDEFAECDGSKEIAKGISIRQQKRQQFGFSYRTYEGNAVDGPENGYIIHLVYGCTASPTSRDHKSTNSSPEAEEMSWEVDTTPVDVPGFKPTAVVEISSTDCAADKLTKLEEILYGSGSEEPRLPLPAELVTLVGTPS